MSKSKLSLFLAIAIAMAVVLRIINLASREFWYDEVLSLLLAGGQKVAYKTPSDVPVILADYQPLLGLPIENSINDIVKTVANLLKGLAAEPHPPLFYLTQHLWLRLFGNGEGAMRSLEVLFSIGAIGSAYGLGRCLLGNQGGLLLAAVLGTNDYYLFHSLNVRMYGQLILWITLSAWAIIELISYQNTHPQTSSDNPSVTKSPPKLKTKLLWHVILSISVACGFMTFYYFVYFLLSLGVLVLILDRQRWWQYGLSLGAGVFITIPWVLWGTRQQLRNADFERFAKASSLGETVSKHFAGVTQTLGTHLFLGDWVTSVPPIAATIAGIIAIALLVACSIHLWQDNHRRAFTVAFLFGIFPLLVALALDIVKGQFTLGFGWGRSMILILPGCLLLLVTWIQLAAGKWQQTAGAVLLILYLTISISDFSLRHRWIFHQIADIIKQEPTTPTLVVMNSNAWGHVLRLAYYTPANLPVQLLAQKSEKLASAVEKTFASQPSTYQRILWLDSARPVWGLPSTPSQQDEVKKLLNEQFQLKSTKQISGTMELDKFTAYLYQR
ncbi:MAG TPA: hypothetical protein DEG17_23800 [Cyanobacteria bacterium UBA11149]|nr:hypothetical protein [Cyanobacteria bacterium UBA11166]HBS69895.1 hypothetical protein [Cyanobacteria bacterium UBA11153]HBW91806.1 hypothetical protein [Cyanobacteria bacterium UBA11149]HCA93766.1 hypothetical protein [Cyanobacteria bacterium UBA9226]